MVEVLGEMNKDKKGDDKSIAIKEIRKFWREFICAIATKIDKEIMEDLTKLEFLKGKSK